MVFGIIPLRFSKIAFSASCILDKGLDTLSAIFQTCNPIKSGEEIKGWLDSAWGYMAMLDYPYETDFLGSLLPAYPVKVRCYKTFKISFFRNPIKNFSGALSD